MANNKALGVASSDPPAVFPIGETHPIALAHAAGVLEVAGPREAERAAVKVAVGEHVGEAEGVVVFL